MLNIFSKLALAKIQKWEMIVIIKIAVILEDLIYKFYISKDY